MINGKKKKWHLTRDDIVALDTVTYTNVAVVKLKPLPSICEPNSSIVNHFVDVIDDDGVQLEEVPMAGIDSKDSIGKFAVDSSNTVYLITAKTEKVEITEDQIVERDQHKQVKKMVDKPLNLTLEMVKSQFQYYDVIYKLKDSVHIVKGQFLLTVYDNLKDDYIYKSLPVTSEREMQIRESLLYSEDLTGMGLLEFHTEPLLADE